MPDPRPTPPERVPSDDLIAQARAYAAVGPYQVSHLLTELAAALEATASEVKDGDEALAETERQLNRALERLEATAAERDRAHARIAELEALLQRMDDAIDPRCDCPDCMGGAAQ